MTREEWNRCVDLLMDFVEECYIDLDNRIEYAVRFLIDKPIKGEITKGKLKWRGLKIIKLYADDCVYYNLKQRDTIIRLKFTPEVEIRFNEWKSKKLKL